MTETTSGDVNQTKGKVGIYKLPNLMIEKLLFRNAGAVGLDHTPAIDSMANGGILGSPLIRQAVWDIDLRMKKS